MEIETDDDEFPWDLNNSLNTNGPELVFVCFAKTTYAYKLWPGIYNKNPKPVNNSCFSLLTKLGVEVLFKFWTNPLLSLYYFFPLWIF